MTAICHVKTVIKFKLMSYKHKYYKFQKNQPLNDFLYRMGGGGGSQESDIKLELSIPESINVL